MYRLGCTSEYSPDNLKLILTENGSKLTENGGTTMTLRKHFAITVWTKFQDHNNVRIWPDNKQKKKLTIS